MSMKWAENEIRIACKKENPDWDEKSFDYGCSCYQSALKAYKSLCDDSHSGFSFSLTKNILIRLMNDLPLTPIEDKDEDWKESICSIQEGKTYQHNRMGSLFKDVYSDGTVKYYDINRCYCQELTDPKDTFRSGVDKIVDELFPITMPYYPESEKYKVVVNTFLAEGYEGDETAFNTRGVLYVITPDGEKVEINKYYGEKDRHLVEITKEEYVERLNHEIHE